MPELQRLVVGDIVPDSVDGTAHFRVAAIDPERALVLHSRRHPTTGIWPDLSAGDPGLYLDFSWVFVLRGIDPGTTRLLLRTRAIVMAGKQPAPFWMRAFLPVADFADFLYTRQMLRGIRRRVESAQRHEPSDSPAPIPDPFCGPTANLSPGTSAAQQAARMLADEGLHERSL